VRVSKSKVLRCGEEKVTGGWRKLHIEKVHNYSVLPVLIG
jgi:hypothetical protein